LPSPDPAGRTAPIYPHTSAGRIIYGGWFSINGMLIPNQAVRMSECSDGTSNNFIVGEQSGMVGTHDYRSRYYGPWGSWNQSLPIEQISDQMNRDMWGMGLTCVAYRPITPQSVSEPPQPPAHRSTGLRGSAYQSNRRK